MMSVGGCKPREGNGEREYWAKPVVLGEEFRQVRIFRRFAVGLAEAGITRWCCFVFLALGGQVDDFSCDFGGEISNGRQSVQRKSTRPGSLAI